MHHPRHGSKSGGSFFIDFFLLIAIRILQGERRCTHYVARRKL